MTLPFYSWQCISLSLNNRDVDIVIKNERVQNNLVKYLLYKLETIEGKAGSATNLIKLMNKEQIETYVNKSSKGSKDNNNLKTLELRIQLSNRIKVVKQAYLRYLMVKFR